MSAFGKIRRPGLRFPLGIVLVLSIGLVALLPASASAAVQWKVDVGAQSRDEAVQVNLFLPQDISVDVGDTVTWTGRTGEIHTVSFGSRPRGSGAAIAPIITGFSQGHVTLSAPTQAANSGLVVQGVIVSATFTHAGDYSYFCLIHPQMNGTIHVAAAGTSYPEPQVLYTTRARSEGAGLIGQGLGLLAQGLAAAIQASPFQQTAVTAGIGEVFPGIESVAVERFLPERRVVHAGQTVTWTNRDPETPHTVTFGTLPQDQVPPGPTVPEQPISVGLAGNTPGSLAPGQGTLNAPPSSSQWLSSGYFGAGRPSGTSFKVTFDTPGTYPYYCALHDVLGMKGTIVVVP